MSEEKGSKLDKKEVVENGIWVKDYLVRATEDGMFLYVEFEKEDVKGMEEFLNDWKEVKEELKNLGFCGVLDNPVVKDGVIFLAKGKPATAPQPSMIMFFPEFKGIFYKYYSLKDDIREVNKIVCVKKGDAIGEWLEGNDGAPGKDVFCEDIPPPEKVEKDCELGEGLFVDEKGLVRAEFSGALLVEDKKIFVEPEYEVPGDVDYSIGNVKFYGKKLIVKGDIRYGFKVEVLEGDLELKGGTENKVFVFVKGDFECNGILRGEETRVVVEGNATLKAVEYARLEVKGSVEIKDYMIFGEIVGMDSLKISEGKGMTYGSVIRVKENIEVKEAGNETQTPTKLIAGYHPEVIGNYLKLLQERFLIEETLKKLQKGIQLGKKLEKEGRLDEKKKKILEQIQEQFVLYSSKLEGVEEKLGNLRKEMSELKTKTVKILRKVYPGVIIGIADITTTIPEEKEGPIKFKLEASIIREVSMN